VLPEGGANLVADCPFSLSRVSAGLCVSAVFVVELAVVLLLYWVLDLDSSFYLLLVTWNSLRYYFDDITFHIVAHASLGGCGMFLSLSAGFSLPQLSTPRSGCAGSSTFLAACSPSPVLWLFASSIGREPRITGPP